MMDPNTFGVIVVVAIALSIPIGAMVLGRMLGPRRETPVKDLPFESGVDNVVGGARQRFSVKFYIIAMIFLVFDLEIIFLFPWAVDYRAMNRSLGIAGFIEMFIFLAILFVGYIYLYKKGALDWEE